MTDKKTLFMYIMVFYIFLSYILGPGVVYHSTDKSFASAGNGFIAGSILSIILWVSYGSKMVENAPLAS